MIPVDGSQDAVPLIQLEQAVALPPLENVIPLLQALQLADAVLAVPAKEYPG